MHSLELSHQSDSYEYPQHTFSWKKKYLLGSTYYLELSLCECNISLLIYPQGQIQDDL